MDDLRSALEPLVRHPSSAAPSMEAIAARARARRARRRRLRTGAMVVVLVGLAIPTWSLARTDHAKELSTAGQAQESQTTDTTLVDAPPPPPEPAGQTDSPFDSTAPWLASPPLAQADVPAFVESWNSDPEAQAQCPLLAPDDLGDGSGATARASDRGQPGAWWVEFDLPGANGEADIQDPVVGAGRATFYVSAILMGDPPAGTSQESVVDRWPDVHVWDDGSEVGWGVSGDGTETPTQFDGTPTAWISYMKVQGSPCMYQVGSYLSRDHLVYLISHLRLVEGAP